MKRIIALTLWVAAMFCLFGCAAKIDEPAEPVRFFYPRPTDSISFVQKDGAITHETRESAGHVGDHAYLLNLYLLGPSAEGLRNPFPSGTKLMFFEVRNGIAEVVLSEPFARLSGMDLTAACACLSLTVQELTGAQTVSIGVAGQQLDGQTRITMRLEDILRNDTSALPDAG